MEYQVDLETFRGPLDLLLFLVKRHEVDIVDIPIAKIADQFNAYLNMIQMIDVEWAGDFLVMAATLMEIKSRELLPRSEENAVEEEEDPRLQLVKQLIEYKKFKDAAKRLDEQAEQQMLRLARRPPNPPRAAIEQQPIQRVELWDLVSAFGRLLREISALQPREIVMDDTPIHIVMEQILERLRRRSPLTLPALFTPPRTRGRLLGIFLALLELIRAHQIVAEQPVLHGEIQVALSEADEDNTAERPTTVD